MSNINLIEFISSLFRLQLMIKMNHWSTNLYHRHKITCDLHDKVLPIIDRLVETFQGRYGKMDASSVLDSNGNKISNMMLTVPIVTDYEFPKYIQDTVDLMIQKVYPNVDKDLTAIIDELLEVLNTGKYLLMLK